MPLDLSKDKCTSKVINVVLPEKTSMNHKTVQSLLWTGIIAAVWHSAHYLEHYIVGVVYTVS